MASKLLKAKKQPSQLPESVLPSGHTGSSFILVTVIFLFVLFWIFQSKKWRFGRPNRYINKWGYVALRAENELEHRYIAIKLLGRDLASNEVVHHINGTKTDNLVRNLCVMDREKHELFHSWLRWKKEKSGAYPAFKDQNRILEKEYGGTLLENIKPLAHTSVPDEIESVEYKPIENKVAGSLENEDKAALRKRLFEGLREERRRIAEARGVPVYIIFNNKTLEEIADYMPVSETLLLKISGVDSEKLRLYGSHFINVVKKFKNAG